MTKWTLILIFVMSWSLTWMVLVTSDGSGPEPGPAQGPCFLEGPEPDFWRRAQARAGPEPDFWERAGKFELFDCCT